MTDRPILSFTSTKARLPMIDDIFASHLKMAKALDMKVCFACQDDSLSAMTDYQKSLVASGEIELLHIPKDHGSNTKWTLCRIAHPESVMVVVDDDWMYDVDGIRSLLEVHTRYPEAVICRAFRSIPWVGDDLPLYKVKPFYTYPKTVTAHIHVNRLKDNVSAREINIRPGSAFPEHFLGILYPAGFPKSDPATITEECRKDDDVEIGNLIAVEGRQLIFAGCDRISMDKDMNLPNSLWQECRSGNGLRTYNALMSVKQNLKSAYGKSKLGQVYLLTCKKYPKRRDSIKKELSRLGMPFIEQYDDGTFKPSIGTTHRHLNRCHLAKYLAISAFLDSAEDYITIIEDDVRFLKDVWPISKALETMPKTFGACRLGWAPSPYIRGEMEKNNPLEVAQTEQHLARAGSFWTKCQYASTDGCTIISRQVATKYHAYLKSVIEDSEGKRIDNSDDLICRVCEELDLPMYVYKPLLCIQVEQNDVEHGKSSVDKFLSPNLYRVQGIVQHIEDYAVDEASIRLPNTKELITDREYRIGVPKVYYGRFHLGCLGTRKTSSNW